MQVGQTIRFMPAVREITKIPTDAFAFKRNPPRFGWLARLCWRLLQKLGALSPHSEKVHSWTYKESDRKAVLDIIKEAHLDLGRYYQKPAEYVIVVGQAEFYEIARDATPYGLAQMTLSVGSLYQHGMRVGEMDVHVVPWLSGVAVIPRAILRSDRGR